MKTLRTLLAEVIDGYGVEIEEWIRPELVGLMAIATLDWLAQPEIDLIIAQPVAAGAALRRAAVQ